MKARDVMSSRALALEDARRTARAGGRIAEVSADADAADAMSALLDGADAVLVRDGDTLCGVITRDDALAILRAALGRGIGRRHHRPAVVRVAGTRGVGKTTLIRGALGRLGGLDAVVLQGNAPSDAGGPREIVDASVHWRAGLTRALEQLRDADLVVVEDRDGEVDMPRGLDEDVQVAVLSPREASGVRPEQLRDVQLAIVSDGGHEAPGLGAAVAALQERCPRLEVIPAGGDAGVEAWAGWLRAQAARRPD